MFLPFRGVNPVQPQCRDKVRSLQPKLAGLGEGKASVCLVLYKTSVSSKWAIGISLSLTYCLVKEAEARSKKPAPTNPYREGRWLEKS